MRSEVSMRWIVALLIVGLGYWMYYEFGLPSGLEPVQDWLAMYIGDLPSLFLVAAVLVCPIVAAWYFLSDPRRRQ